MSTVTTLKPVFVEFMPDKRVDGELYVSLEFGTAIHNCCCGCGSQVVTPLSPTDWRLIFDGTVSLEPSIGNWSFPCRSHYWITHNRVEWAGQWSQERVEAGRAYDRAMKDRRFAEDREPLQSESASAPEPSHPSTLWGRLRAWWAR